MQKKKIVTALAVVFGLSAMPPALWAAHHEGSSMEQAGHEAKQETEGMKQEGATEGAAGTMKEAMPEGSDGGMTQEAGEKMSEGSH